MTARLVREVGMDGPSVHESEAGLYICRVDCVPFWLFPPTTYIRPLIKSLPAPLRATGDEAPFVHESEDGL
jgi:hypothetical protein